MSTDSKSLISGEAMSAIPELERALHGSGGSSLPRAILDLRPDESEEAEVKDRLSRLLSRATALKRFDNVNEFRFKDIGALYGEALRAGCPEYVVDVLNYLQLYQVLAGEMRMLKLEGEKWFGARGPRGAAPGLLAAAEDVDDFMPELLSSKLVLGKLSALQSREAASLHFADARTRLDGLVELFERECGACTYFDDAAMERIGGTIAERRASLPSRYEHSPIRLEKTRFLALMSCERSFLRVYLPYWLSIAEYLKPQGFAYHLLITDSSGKATDMVEKADALRRALARFRGYDSTTFGDNISFSSVPVPPWCPDEKSYSAGARFLYARDLSEHTGMRVIVQDIDLCVSHDPLPWFEAMPAEKIVLGSYSPYLTIDPWRKFSAGVFALPHVDSAFGLMRSVEDYLLKGLGERHSWFLDQNALAYLHDKAIQGDGTVAEVLFSLDGNRTGLAPYHGGLRPIHGLPVHGLFERSQI